MSFIGNQILYKKDSEYSYNELILDCGALELLIRYYNNLDLNRILIRELSFLSSELNSNSIYRHSYFKYPTLVYKDVDNIDIECLIRIIKALNEIILVLKSSYIKLDYLEEEEWYFITRKIRFIASNTNLQLSNIREDALLNIANNTHKLPGVITNIIVTNSELSLHILNYAYEPTLNNYKYTRKYYFNKCIFINRPIRILSELKDDIKIDFYNTYTKVYVEDSTFNFAYNNQSLISELSPNYLRLNGNFEFINIRILSYFNNPLLIEMDSTDELNNLSLVNIYTEDNDLIPIGLKIKGTVSKLNLCNVKLQELSLNNYSINHFSLTKVDMTDLAPCDSIDLMRIAFVKNLILHSTLNQLGNTNDIGNLLSYFRRIQILEINDDCINSFPTFIKSLNKVNELNFISLLTDITLKGVSKEEAAILSDIECKLLSFYRDSDSCYKSLIPLILYERLNIIFTDNSILDTNVLLFLPNGMLSSYTSIVKDFLLEILSPNKEWGQFNPFKGDNFFLLNSLNFSLETFYIFNLINIKSSEWIIERAVYEGNITLIDAGSDVLIRIKDSVIVEGLYGIKHQNFLSTLNNFRFLLLVCPSTKKVHYINVDVDIINYREALDWTNRNINNRDFISES